jgi:Dolichyl-phosphate-mannose-protein mannosyltransferase
VTNRLTASSATMLALAGGVIAGVAYTLSPLTVLCALALVAIIRWGSRGLTPRERRWFLTLVIVAIVARVVLVAGLFLTADSRLPYATFFGDEELFKNRSIWLRNLALGLSVSPADIIYAVEETGRSSYQYVLALVQALVGNAPYGIHVLNATLFVTSVIALYRLVRPVFGGLVAMAGMTLLLYLPSLFVWSASALKEPLYIFVAVAELVCVVYIARGARWWHRAFAVIGVVLSAVALESVRKGGALVALVGSATGLAASFALTRPRVLVASLIGVPVVAAIVLSNPGIQQRLLRQARQAAVYHAGHLATPGYAYQILDPRYYENRILLVRSLPRREAAAFAVRSLVSYVTEPLPWKGDSLFLRAYLPEHIVWWVLVALLPFGVIAGLRLDPVLTMILCAHGAMIMFVVALTSGNAGTLVRHRGLVLPYVVWLSALGGVAIARWMTPSLATLVASDTKQRAHGDS